MPWALLRHPDTSQPAAEECLVNMTVFPFPGNENNYDTLCELSVCWRGLEGRPGSWVASIPPDFAECQLNVRKLFLEGFIHVLLEI